MKYSFETSPEALGLKVERPPGKRLVLGLDLASTTGYCLAYYRPGDPVVLKDLQLLFGQLDLAAAAYDRGAIRFVRLRQFLSVIKPDAVFYELVRTQPAGVNRMNMNALFSRVATASELLGAFKSHVCCWCEENDVPCTGFGIGTIKKRATGKGNVGKEDIIRACNSQLGCEFEVGGYETTGVDNVADSIWTCVLGLEQYGLGLPLPGEEEVRAEPGAVES